MYAVPAALMFPAAVRTDLSRNSDRLQLDCRRDPVRASASSELVSVIRCIGRLLDVPSNFVLVQIPLFIFMGALLERSRIAEKAVHGAAAVSGPLSRRALGMPPSSSARSSRRVPAWSGPCEIVVGLMAVPTMMAAGYRKDLICWNHLRRWIARHHHSAFGDCRDLCLDHRHVDRGSDGRILIPGLIMTRLFVPMWSSAATCGRRTVRRCSREELDDAVTLRQKLWLLRDSAIAMRRSDRCGAGKHLCGRRLADEASAVGVVGPLLLVLAYGQFSCAGRSTDALRSTITITAMTMMIILGGTIFTSAFLINGGSAVVDAR